ncbi:hypothetical protein C5167_040095 [Papaver somniferum]|uniref:CCT domain-containing protein n=1 Tax=Papaver somniferum TaxID=3469 RepID=A0A4Y7II56_PAPSO|nr:zinc finger protein CONSTANS-LIKE 8-like [Papaver somniferum]RZC47118.1 hypothetical protein C5167_040095 [Papaver somniferum]
MASNSLFSSDHIFSSEFSQIPPVSVSVEESLESSLMWNQEFILPSSEKNGYTNNDPIILPSNDLTFSSNFDGVLPFPEQLKILPMTDYVPEPILMTSNEFDVGLSDYNSTGNNSLQHQYQKAAEFLHFQQPDHELSAYSDEELLFNKTYSENVFGPRFDHAAGYFGDHNIWEMHHNLQGNYNSTSSFQSSSVEEPKVRRYTKEERNDRILKYLKKKNQRNFNKTIKYVCRKTLADRRIRIRGRFARNNEYPEELSATSTTKNNTNDHEEEDKYHYSHGPYFQNSTPETKLNIELEDEEWLREAVNNLMYLPIFD